MTGANAALVIAEAHAHDSVEAVFDGAVLADDGGETVGPVSGKGDVEAGFDAVVIAIDARVPADGRVVHVFATIESFAASWYAQNDGATLDQYNVTALFVASAAKG